MIYLFYLQSEKVLLEKEKLQLTVSQERKNEIPALFISFFRRRRISSNEKEIVSLPSLTPSLRSVVMLGTLPLTWSTRFERIAMPG